MIRVLVSLADFDTGVAIARALRSGLRDIQVVAVRPDATSPPPPDGVSDEVRMMSSPEGANESTRTSVLDDADVFLPSSPRETQDLASQRSSNDTLLAPSEAVLGRTRGPQPEVVDRLPLRVPDWLSVDAPVEDLHAFGRRYNWSVGMRRTDGQRHPVSHWTDFESLRENLVDQAHPEEDVYLEHNVNGMRLLVSFAADCGRALDIRMLRRGTAQRSWDLVSVPNPLRTALVDALHTLEWTGGGSIDLVETSNGDLWLNQWRTCFGPEVDALAACGANLPARLVAARTGASLIEAVSSASTVVEVKRQVPASTPSPKVGSAQSNAALDGTSARPGSRRTDVPTDPMTQSLDDIVAELPDDGALGNTPRHLLLPKKTTRRFAAFVDAANRVESTFGLETARVGISIKTNPADRLLRAARESGMLAETIHRDEMKHAQTHGYSVDEMIVNGPVQALLPHLPNAPYALFGDAVKDLESLPFDPSDSIVGVRTRPPERGPSRFGVDLSEPKRMDRLCTTVSTLPPETRIGLHFHAPSSTLGHDQWWASLDRVLDWAATIQERTTRPLECLDLGGGWHPDDWLDVFIPGLLERKDRIRHVLPDLRTLLLEPGKALSQPLGIVESRVLDVRPSRSEVILDASIAELSNIDYHPHRLLAHTDDRGWHRLTRGGGRLLGRLCMEADILGRQRAVSHLSPGDPVVVCDAGAYDASMTYPFGRGRTAAHEEAEHL